MEFNRLHENDYQAFLDLYNESFPADERREYRDANHLAGFINIKNGKFNIFAAKDGDRFLGFLSYWNLKGYTYIEHFAVIPEKRGNNIGSGMLNHLFTDVSGNVLIEVEIPGSHEAERRIHFYERNGFRVRDEFDYVQPPYSSGKNPVKMLLMTHGEVTLRCLDSIKDMLREVYNVDHII